MRLIAVHSDGSCWNKEGHKHLMGCGVAVFVDGVYEEDLSRAWGVIDYKNGSNNVAEWLALVEAARIVKDLKKSFPGHKFVVCSDSQIITNQFNGTYAINQEVFREYWKQAKRYKSIDAIKWIPREQNKEADKLSKIGLDTVKQL